jgi:uncharacterized protein (DUF302 family)
MSIEEGKAGEMATKEISVERFSVTSSKSFPDVVAAIEKNIGRPDMNKFLGDVASARTEGEMEKIVHGAVGTSDLMEFTRFDQGGILRKELGETAPQVLRLVVGNPLIMKQMVKLVPDAGSYAPVTILIDERSDGVHISYDRTASLIASYENLEARKVAHGLDSKVEALLEAAAH